MPFNDEDSDQAAADASAADASAREQGLAMAIPPADEPLDGGNLTTLGQVTTRTIQRLTDGQARPKIGAVKGTVEAVPPDLGKHVLMLYAMQQKLGEQVPELMRYEIDPNDLATNQGLLGLAETIGAMGDDEDLAMALKQPMGGGEAPAEEPAEPAEVDDGG